MFAARPLDRPVVRRLVVLKLAYDWDDLGQLVRRTITIDPDKIRADCVRCFEFLVDLTPEESVLAKDSHQRERSLWERLRAELAGG